MENFLRGFYKRAATRKASTCCEEPFGFWLDEAKKEEEALKRDKKESKVDPRDVSESFAMGSYPR